MLHFLLSLSSQLYHDLLGKLVWLFLAGVIFIPLERLFSLRKLPILRPAFVTDLSYFFINGLGTKFLVAYVTGLIAVFAHNVAPASLHPWVADLPLGVRLPAAVIVGDIGYYWGHRLMHEVRWLWKIHAVHHSAERIDWLVNSRVHPLDIVLSRFAGLLPIYVLGLNGGGAGSSGGVDVMNAYIVIGTLWSFLVHANVRFRFGWLEQVVATPYFHHWHHTNDSPDVIDKNYAAIFPWIDRLFGTLYLPGKQWPGVYGTNTPMPEHLVDQLIQPFTTPAETARQAVPPQA